MCFWKEHKRGWRTRCRISLIAPKAIHHLKCVSRFGLISCAISDKRDADQVLGTIVEALIGRFRPTQSSSSVHVSLSKFASQRLFLYYFVVGQFARRVRKKTCLQEPLENPQFCSRFQPRPEGNQLCKRNPADYCFFGIPVFMLGAHSTGPNSYSSSRLWSESKTDALPQSKRNAVESASCSERQPSALASSSSMAMVGRQLNYQNLWMLPMSTGK